MARGRLAEAGAELAAALELLRTHPVPIVAWKTYAALGRLHVRTGRNREAREAFAQAAEIVGQIAASVDDQKLLATFLNSPPVKEVLACAAEGKGREVQ